jgi:hypothetical protein
MNSIVPAAQPMNTIQRAPTAHKPPPRSRRRNGPPSAVVNKGTINERSQTRDALRLATVTTEDERIFAALDRMREGTGIKREDVSDRILCQTGAAILGHWQPTDKSAEDKLVTAANALAESEPRNITELMLTVQMLASE